MPWQKTFSLGKRSKGCHLVTDEIVGHISEGLKDTKVRVFQDRVVLANLQTSQIGILYLFM